MNTTPWYILGPGSIGLLWACRFKQCNLGPILLFKDASTVTAYRNTGETVCLTSSSGKTSRIKVPGQNSITLTTPIKRLLITTKAHKTRQALNAISHLITPEATIIILQNGLGSYEYCREQLATPHIYNASTTDGVHQPKRYQPIIAGLSESWIGQQENEPSNPSIKELVAAFQQHSIDLIWDDNIQQRLWHKLVVNCAINGLTVLFHCPNGDLLKNSSAHNTMTALCQELDSLLRANQIPLPKGGSLTLATSVATQTALNRSSMLQDFEAERGAEIDAIYGYACQQAKQLKLNTPALAAIYQQLQALFTPFS